MGSKSIRDGDSPSASTFLIPQLRHSRRGSLASLSSASQLDRETLSQALDHIHNTASQTETLTTFNEYTTPPSSSSGPESKGIAGELQGGLSGLYSRFRASVGNVKDVVNLGVEESVVEEATSLTNAKRGIKSPAPSTKGTSQPARVASSSASTLLESPTSRSGRQSPVATSNLDTLRSDPNRQSKLSKASLGATSSKSASESLAGLKFPPATLTQAAQPSTIRPALAEVNISAVKQGSLSADPLSCTTTVFPGETLQFDSSIGAQSIQTGPRAKNEIDAAGPFDSDAVLSHKSARTISDYQAGASASDRFRTVAASLHQPLGDRERVKSAGPQSEDSVQPFPSFQVDHEKLTYAGTEASSDADDDEMAIGPRFITSHGNGGGNVLTAADRDGEPGPAHSFTRKKGYQHLALPLRKSMAPPVLSRSQSPNPSLSRASSSEADAGSLATSLSRRMPPTDGIVSPNPAQIRTSTSRPTDPSVVHRDLRTLNVFSQVKNKVLNKEYWMKDENAKDCFYCGDPFTTFRRKHHCSKLFPL